MIKKLISALLVMALFSACANIPEERNFEPNQPISRKGNFLGPSEYTQNGHFYPQGEFENAIKDMPDAKSNYKTARVYGVIGVVAALTSLVAIIAAIGAKSSDKSPLLITWGAAFGVDIVSTKISDHYYNNAVEIYNQKVKPKPTAYLLNYGWQF